MSALFYYSCTTSRTAGRRHLEEADKQKRRVLRTSERRQLMRELGLEDKDPEAYEKMNGATDEKAHVTKEKEETVEKVLMAYEIDECEQYEVKSVPSIGWCVEINSVSDIQMMTDDEPIPELVLVTKEEVTQIENKNDSEKE